MTDDGHLFTQSVMFFAKRRTNCIIPPSGQNNDCTLFRQAAAVRLFREAAISVISQNSYRHFAKQLPSFRKTPVATLFREATHNKKPLAPLERGEGNIGAYPR